MKNDLKPSGEEGRVHALTVNYLPELVLLQIFAFLGLKDLMMASAVCKRWRRLCHDDRFWINLDLSQDINIRRLCNKSVKYILRRTTNIRNLNLSGNRCRWVTNDSLFHISRYCPKLRSLNVSSRRKITDKGMKEIATYCPALENLLIEGCSRISNGSLINLGKNCQNLKTINLGKCKLIQNFGLEALVKNCTALTSISLEGCKKVTDRGLKIIANNCHALKSINLKRMRNITNTGIREFLEKVPVSGISIGLLRSGGITDNIFYIISGHCPQLEVFDFEHYARFVVDGFILRVAEGCSRLNRLSLYHCYPLSDMTLMRITQICPDLGDIHLYPETYLHWISFDNQCVDVMLMAYFP